MSVVLRNGMVELHWQGQLLESRFVSGPFAPVDFPTFSAPRFWIAQ